ncbi:hypothetical protein KC19_6G095100 [Ceratodon purpureus]|uniref:Uncharacterized protein n=1 Tax=Ceratodon purpureus TaxID=3225 RepID=A0A8T0HCK0_CERPU|nr:hypothetical protein KC19_6G095100 [Ceratodon purpureus]
MSCDFHLAGFKGLGFRVCMTHLVIHFDLECSISRLLICFVIVESDALNGDSAGISRALYIMRLVCWSVAAW